MLRILQFGENGQVATELRRLAGPECAVTVVARKQADLTDPESLQAAIGGAGAIDMVVNAAAYTAVDRAESEPELAHAVNAVAPGIIAEACARRGVPLLHISTDYVFDGSREGAYREDDLTNPINVYGASKLAGENKLRETSDRHVILRTSWVYAAHGSNFVRTMLRLGAERDELKIVNDQHGAPTSAATIAGAILEIGRQWTERPGPEKFGTFHLTGGGQTTWFGLAEEIFRRASWAGLRARLVPIPSSAYPTPARRPANSRLDLEKIRQVFGIAPPDWREPLQTVLEELRTPPQP